MLEKLKEQEQLQKRNKKIEVEIKALLCGSAFIYKKLSFLILMRQLKRGKKIMFGIRIIFGKFGKGKGVTNTIIATQEMKDKELYKMSMFEIEQLEIEQNRPFARPPEPHVVFANYDINYKGLKRHFFDPDKFMLPNDEFDYDIYPPYACFHIEEGQSGTFSSYDWSDFPKPALLAFARVRHAKYLFNIDLQFITNLNKNLRRFAFEYVTPLELEHEYNSLNMLVKTTVHAGVFYDYEKAVEFETTQDPKLVEELRDYVFNGNIYNCYDSFSKKREFFEVPNDKDFCYDVAILKDLKRKKRTEIVI